MLGTSLLCVSSIQNADKKTLKYKLNEIRFDDKLYFFSFFPHPRFTCSIRCVRSAHSYDFRNL